MIDIQDRLALREYLVKYAYQYNDKRPFVLASGHSSPEYLDCRQALSLAGALPLLGSVFFQLLLPDVDAVGGLTMGADPIAVATAMVSRNVMWFSVRKDRKGHGRKRMVDGAVHRGQRVAVVDDVVTTGESTIDAIVKCVGSGLIVRQVLVLVDREDGGMDKIRSHVHSDVSVSAVFRISEIRSAWHKSEAVYL
jgi:orotate phosphoribosyltransferase